MSRAVLAAIVAITAGQVSADIIKEIKERGALRIGVAEGPPYQFPDPDSGEWVGMNIDLANQAAAIMGVKLEIVPATWATLVTGLEVGQYDVIFANLFATPERALSVAFTQPYDTCGQVLMPAAHEGRVGLAAVIVDLVSAIRAGRRPHARPAVGPRGAAASLSMVLAMRKSMSRGGRSETVTPLGLMGDASKSPVARSRSAAGMNPGQVP